MCLGQLAPVCSPLRPPRPLRPLAWPAVARGLRPRLVARIGARLLRSSLGVVHAGTPRAAHSAVRAAAMTGTLRCSRFLSRTMRPSTRRPQMMTHPRPRQTRPSGAQLRCSSGMATVQLRAPQSSSVQLCAALCSSVQQCSTARCGLCPWRPPLLARGLHWRAAQLAAGLPPSRAAALDAAGAVSAAGAASAAPAASTASGVACEGSRHPLSARGPLKASAPGA